MKFEFSKDYTEIQCIDTFSWLILSSKNLRPPLLSIYEKNKAKISLLTSKFNTTKNILLNSGSVESDMIKGKIWALFMSQTLDITLDQEVYKVFLKTFPKYPNLVQLGGDAIAKVVISKTEESALELIVSCTYFIARKYQTADKIPRDLKHIIEIFEKAAIKSLPHSEDLQPIDNPGSFKNILNNSKTIDDIIDLERKLWLYPIILKNKYNIEKAPQYFSSPLFPKRNKIYEENIKKGIDIIDILVNDPCFSLFGVLPILSMFFSIADLENINLEELTTDSNLSKFELENIWSAYLREKNRIKIEVKYPNFPEQSSVIITGILFKYLLKALKKDKIMAKKLISIVPKNTTQTKTEKELKKTMDENAKLREDMVKLRLENENLKKSSTQRTQDAMAPLEGEIRSLKESLEESDIERLLLKNDVLNELQALREFVFNMEKQENNEDLKTPPLSEYIKGKKIVIIGGPESWLIKMRGLYKNETISFVSGEKATLDTNSLIHGQDYVFIYASHLGHSLYHKVIRSCKTYNVPFSYLGYHRHVEFIEKEIIDYFISQVSLPH